MFRGPFWLQSAFIWTVADIKAVADIEAVADIGAVADIEAVADIGAVADIKAVADIGGLSPEPLQDFGVRTLLIIGPTLLPVRTTTNLVESGTAF